MINQQYGGYDLWMINRFMMIYRLLGGWALPRKMMDFVSDDEIPNWQVNNVPNHPVHDLWWFIYSQCDAPKSQTCCQTFVDSGMTIICAKLVKGVWCVIGFVTLYSLGYKTWLPAKACPNLEQNQLFLSAEQYFFLGLHLPNQRGASFDFHYQLLGGPCTRYSMVVHGQLHGNYIILGFAVVLSLWSMDFE